MRPRFTLVSSGRVSELEVDTRTDVYSLGVLLYELLTGSAWANYGPPITGTGQTAMVAMSVGSNAQGFYRVLVTHAP